MSSRVIILVRSFVHSSTLILFKNKNEDYGRRPFLASVPHKQTKLMNEKN